jgi:beta-galactosidase GanA
MTCVNPESTQEFCQNYLLSPVYVCPNNPHNTISLGALQAYTSFNHTIIETHNKLKLHDVYNKKHQLKVTTDNGLDYVKLQISSFHTSRKHQKVTMNNISTMPNEPTASLSIIDTSVPKLRFPPSVTTHIGILYPLPSKCLSKT